MEAPFLTLQDAVGHAVVVHDASGAKAACGVIEMASSRRLGGATPAPTENYYYYEPTKKKLVVDVRDKDDLELYYKTIPDYFEQDDGRKLTEIPDRTSTDMIEGRY